MVAVLSTNLIIFGSGQPYKQGVIQKSSDQLQLDNRPVQNHVKLKENAQLGGKLQRHPYLD